ncbi:MAG: thrombospondin type 3 repeat-containing protein [Persicimonas sp.]
MADEDDNCPLESNPEQLDLDGDGRGDACDEDADGDQISDSIDACPAVAGPGTGDGCPEEAEDSGGCNTAGGTPSGTFWLLAMAALLVIRRARSAWAR